MNTHTIITTDGGSLLLSTSEKTSTDTVVLFVPGMSGKAQSDRFQPLVDCCLEANYPIARLAAWEGADDANAQTYAHWQSVIASAVATLQKVGFSSVIAIGKSFGGGLLLSQYTPAVTTKILWAPAIGFAATETLSLLRNTPSRAYKLIDLKLSPDLLIKETAHVAIIHGDADEVISAANSRQIVEVVHSGAITIVPGASHSFSDPEHEQALLDHTRRCLKL